VPREATEVFKKRKGKGIGGCIWWNMHSCMNGKIRPVETVLRMVEKGIKENDGGGEFN
jgi:hypothetical protein